VVAGFEALVRVHAEAPVGVHVEAAFAAAFEAALEAPIEAQVEAPVGVQVVPPAGAQVEARWSGLGCDLTPAPAGLFVLAVAPSAVKAGELAHWIQSPWRFRRVWVLSVLPYLLWSSERCYTFNHRGVCPISASICRGLHERRK
jgi:hypothetical protein